MCLPVRRTPSEHLNVASCVYSLLMVSQRRTSRLTLSTATYTRTHSVLDDLLIHELKIGPLDRVSHYCVSRFHDLDIFWHLTYLSVHSDYYKDFPKL